ncbi:hypothetical protein ABT127_29955 [Streptomyces sp. NPDC001904]|uniref:hypothetical protein n=1 Tax=Streptomyces sp. NPDC001904 TaxID=3154531 RepID=UPI0033336715
MALPGRLTMSGREEGCEGIVAKRAASTYGPERRWRKIRHSEVVDAHVVGFTGTPARPQHLAVRLPAGRIALTQTLDTRLTAQIAPHLRQGAHDEESDRKVTAAGEPYRPVPTDLIVEVAAGTTRDAVVTLIRTR